MYAIIKTGGKQYRVQKDDVLKIEKINAEVGEIVSFDEVMAVGGDKLIIGNPYVEDFVVNAEVVEHGKNDKVIIYKYKAKKDYRRKNGHRQPYTMVKVTDIGEAGSVKTTKAAEPVKEEKAETVAATEKKAEVIDFATAAAEADRKAEAAAKAAESKKDYDDPTATKASEVNYKAKYILNKNKMRVHTPDCSMLARTNKENVEGSNDNIEKLLKEGWDPCDYCLKEYAEVLRNNR